LNIQNQPYQTFQASDSPLTLPLSAIDAGLLPLVGGKAANLGELIQGELPVPGGFCITTTAYELASRRAGLEPILHELATIMADDTARLEQYAAAARAALLAVTIPITVVEAIREAYHEPLPVAVRSSATAEDLPFASFAGQQETYLNVIGIDALLDAVRRCWASLWTDRAVSYRTNNNIDARTVSLAVVVQQMVNATVAGVLFTANPLTGRRRQTIIDANPGLGEAVVFGAVNPDHFVVNSASGEIIERRLGEKQLLIRALSSGGIERIESEEQSKISSLTEKQIVALAKLGMQVEAHFGAPQDTEWAIDNTGELWLTQARPITTLFPLPVGAPSSDEDLRVYFSFDITQGTTGPLTPMGISTLRALGSSLIAVFTGTPLRDPLHGPRSITEAACRIYVDVTPALRNRPGRWFLFQAAAQAEPRTVVIFRQLITDPRLSLLPTPRWRFLRALLRIVIRTRLPLGLLSALLRPPAEWRRMRRLSNQVSQLGSLPASASASERLAAVERLLLEELPRMLSIIGPAVPTSLLTFNAAGRVLGKLATTSELQTVLRGVPHNPTTEMNLALWVLAQQVQADLALVRLVRETPAARLAEDYQEVRLPTPLQHNLEHFLATYGHRGVDEIDLGLARWWENPTYVLGILASYLQLRDAAQAPDAQYRRAVQEAEAMVAELVRRAARKNWLRGLLARFFLGRARALGALREMGRYIITILLDRVRALLRSLGTALVQDGRLETAEDIFFITLLEAHEALAGTDMRSLVRVRRAAYEQELTRRHVPLVLLSDGTEPSAATSVAEAGQEMLQGTPASPGIVTAPARVILDPHGAHLEPGEILVAPTTDPGWTPLFLNAGGLVMEMGGAMSHGVIVAREYGIPAVVGVSGAIERISTGQQITVDGSQGIVTFA